MKKTIRLTESDLLRLINKVAKLYDPNTEPEYSNAEEFNPIITDGNENPRPFKVGDVIKRVGGSGLSKVVGYKGDMIQVKPLNSESLYGMDDINPDVLNRVISMGYKPSYDRPAMFHYRYANDYEVVPQLDK